MAALRNLNKILRFCSVTISFPFASTRSRFVFGDQTLSYFSPQNHKFLWTTIPTSQDESFTVNYLIYSCGLSPEGAISASKKVKLQSPEIADSVLVHFRNHGFSQTQIAQVFRTVPQVLNSDFEKAVLPRLEYLTSVGISREELAKTVASTPALLARSLEKQIIPANEFLRSMLPHKSVVAILRHDSRILLANHSNSVLPNIKLLREQGMSQSCISMSLCHQFTRLVILKHQRFAQLVCEAKEMGFDMKNSTSLLAMRVLWIKNSFNRNRQVYMMRWGWSEDDVLSAFRKFPPSMGVSEKKLMQVMEFIVNKMGWPSVIIAKYPAILTFSLEKRIIPRCSVFKVLLSKGLINENLSLQYLVMVTEEQFLERFVTMFVNQIPQLMSLYQGNVDIEEVN